LADGDTGRPICLAREGQPRCAECNLAPGARVDGALRNAAPIQPEAQRTERHGRQRPVCRKFNPHMALFDCEIGQVNIAFRRPADRERFLLHHPVADDLTPGGGEIDGADQECHCRPLTSSRTR